MPLGIQSIFYAANVGEEEDGDLVESYESVENKEGANSNIDR